MSFYIGFLCIVGGGGAYFERAGMQRNLKKVEIVGELGLTRALILSSISINFWFFLLTGIYCVLTQIFLKVLFVSTNQQGM